MKRKKIIFVCISVALCILVYTSSETYQFQANIKPRLKNITENSKSRYEKEFTPYSLEEKQKIRQDTLKNACSKLKLESVVPQDDVKFIKYINRTSLYFSDKYKLLACLIPKVGCTNFKRFLMVAEKLVNVTDPNKLEMNIHNIADRLLLLKNLNNATSIKRRIATYYKVIVVREPLHRLIISIPR